MMSEKLDTSEKIQAELLAAAMARGIVSLSPFLHLLTSHIKQASIFSVGKFDGGRYASRNGHNEFKQKRRGKYCVFLICMSICLMGQCILIPENKLFLTGVAHARADGSSVER